MLKVYRGINKSGEPVVFVDGNPEEWVQQIVTKFSGDQVGDPENGTVATLIGTITKVEVDYQDDPVEEIVSSVLDDGSDDAVNEEIEKLNVEIAKRGLKVIKETAETRLIKVSKAIEEIDGEDDTTEEEEERTVLAVVLEPNDGEDGAPFEPDTQGEIYSADAIKDTAWRWMENGGKIGLMHQLDVSDKVAVLETFIAPVDFTFSEGVESYLVRKGTWLLRLRIYDDLLWEKAKDGTLGAFSVGGTAEAEILDDEEG